MIEVRILSFLCSLVSFLNIIPIVLIALEEEEFFNIGVFDSDMLEDSTLKISFPEK